MIPTHRRATEILFALALAPFGGLAAQSTENVFVEKVMEDTAIVRRINGARYRIEKGIGCISLERFEHRDITIVSPGVFLGVGSTIQLSDLGQECRVWESSELRNGESESGSGIPPGPDDEKVSTGLTVVVTAVAVAIAYLMSRR